jgi:hypothetical protein
MVVHVEALLRRRWNDVLAEPLPDKWLDLLCTLERKQAAKPVSENVR